VGQQRADFVRNRGVDTMLLGLEEGYAIVSVVVGQCQKQMGHAAKWKNRCLADCQYW